MAFPDETAGASVIDGCCVWQCNMARLCPNDAGSLVATFTGLMCAAARILIQYRSRCAVRFSISFRKFIINSLSAVQVSLVTVVKMETWAE